MTATTSPSRIDLSAIKKAGAKKTTVYPALRDARATELAGEIFDLTDQAEAITANLEIRKAELRSLAMPQFFIQCHGKAEIPSSMVAAAPTGRELRVTFTSKYKEPTSADLLMLALGGHGSRLLVPGFTLKLDSSKIPQAAQQQVVNDILEVLAKHNATDALTAKEVTTPSEDFHTVRHTLFTPEENMAIENIMPMTVSVNTKGRG